MSAALPEPHGRVGVLLAAALVAITGVVGAGWWSAQRLANAFHWVDHTHQVLYELQAALVHAVGMQSGVRGFSLTGDERYLAPYESGLLGVQHSIARMRELTADNARQQSRLTQLSSLVNEEVSIMQERIAARRRGGLTGASQVASDGRGKRVIDAIRGLVTAMQNEERGLLEERSLTARRTGWAALAVLGGIAAIAAGLILTAMRRLRSGRGAALVEARA
jgi:CHASE3 domain sensor protein